MSDDKLPPLDKVIAALKIGHKYLGPDTADLAAAAWLERQQTEIERLKLEYQLAHDDWKRSEAEIERLRAEVRCLRIDNARLRDNAAIGGLMP